MNAVAWFSSHSNFVLSDGFKNVIQMLLKFSCFFFYKITKITQRLEATSPDLWCVYLFIYQLRLHSDTFSTTACILILFRLCNFY